MRVHGNNSTDQMTRSSNFDKFLANTNQSMDDLPKQRGNRPFQCSECGLMFAARADLRAHVTRTHRNLSTSVNTNTTSTPTRRPQRRAASLQHRYIGTSSGAEDDDQPQVGQQQGEDDFRCPICHRQFTSARFLDRHTYAVHEPKQDTYDERDYHGNHMAEEEEEDDVRDYADDELEEKNTAAPVHTNVPKTNDGIVGETDEYYEEEQALLDEEELDLAPNVEDIIDEDEANEQLPTIKSISSAHRKQIGIVRKFDELEPDVHDNQPTKRSCTINRSK